MARKLSATDLKHGEGTVYQRSNGRWQGATVLPSGARRYVSGETEDDVVRQLLNMRRQAEAGTLEASPKVTVERLMETWLSTVVKPNKAANTYHLYEAMARMHVIPALGRLPLSRLTLSHVQGWLGDEAARGYAPRTLGMMRLVLASALRWAEKAELVHRNVAKLSDPPPVARQHYNAFGPAELPAFLRLVEDHTYGAVYVTLAGTGLRIGEALGLTWTAVDLEKRVLRITHQLDWQEGRFVFAPLKRAASRRTVMLPGFVVSALKLHRHRQRERRLEAGGGWGDLDLVFTTRTGLPIHEHAVRSAFARLMERAGWGHWKPHDLRHSYATLLLAQETDAPTMKELMGHGSITSTLDLYPRILDESKRRAADALDAILDG